MATDETPTADEIKDAVAADAEAGIQSFSDGTNTVTMVDLEKRLDVASKIDRRSARNTPLASVFKNTVQLVSGQGGFR